MFYVLQPGDQKIHYLKGKIKTCHLKALNQKPTTIKSLSFLSDKTTLRICDMKRIYWSSPSLYDIYLTHKVKRIRMKFKNYLNQITKRKKQQLTEKCYL